MTEKIIVQESTDTINVVDQNTKPHISEVLKIIQQVSGGTTNLTAAEILTAIKTVDGSNSGLDADMLDGQHAASFSGIVHNHTIGETTNLQNILDNQGATADAALPKAGGTMSGNIVMAGTELVDGRDVSVDGAKLDFLAVTQPVDLDAIDTRVNALDAAVVLRGNWDASLGTFPGGGTAQAGDSYIVSVGGTVGGVVFAANDRIIAILDNASTTVFAANWIKADYTDQVLSVAGLTGAISDTGLRAAINVEAGSTADQTDAEIKAAYQTAVPLISQVDAQAGVAVAIESWSALRVAQAIAALGGGGGDFKADGTVDMTGELGTDVGTFRSDVADGATAVGFSYNTSAALIAAGAKLASWKNNGVEKAYIDKDGDIVFQPDGTRNQISIESDGNDRYVVTPSVWVGFKSGGINGNGIFRVRENAIEMIFGDSNKLQAFEIASWTTGNYSSDFTISGHTRVVDEARKALIVKGGDQAGGATTNLVGGVLALKGGLGASGSAGAAHGGNVTIDGGTGFGTGHKGYIIMAGLPTADPGVSGALWVSAGALMVSA